MVSYIDAMNTDRQIKGQSSGEHASSYRVCVAGSIPSNWANRLGCLEVVQPVGDRSSDQTLLMGDVRDQAELLGILNTLHELRLPLLLVEAVDPELWPCKPKVAEQPTPSGHGVQSGSENR